MTGQPALISRDGVPAQFPTQAHPPEFWEQLGRTIATFGFLERTLGRAIFAFTATTEYSEEAMQKEFDKWLARLQHALTDTLHPLAESYGKAVREHTRSKFENVGELVEDLKAAAKVRNTLCHGSWGMPDASGKSTPHYFSKKDGKFEIAVDIEYLRQVQSHVRGLIYAVVDSVTVMGWKFPGATGPGAEIW